MIAKAHFRVRVSFHGEMGSVAGAAHGSATSVSLTENYVFLNPPARIRFFRFRTKVYI